MTLPELAIRRPVTTSVILITIFVIGGIALTRLPLSFLPEMEEPRLFVIVNYPNASPQAAEQLIIQPLEERLNTIKGLDRMWSRADDRGIRINLRFEWGEDLDMVRMQVREVVDRVRDDLPESVESIQISNQWNPRESGETIMEGRISSKRDLSSDYALLERKIVKPMERIPGVASVLLDGVNPKEVRINLKLDALKRHKVDPRQVVDAIESNDEDRSLGILRTQESKLTVRGLGRIQSISQFEKLPLPGTNLRLSDVAEITYEEPPLEYGRHLDGNFALGISVVKESSGNTVEISRQVIQKVAELDKDPELEGVTLLVWQDQGQEIKKTLMDLRNNGILGALLASLVLFLFLRKLASTSVAVICIPLSLLVACGVVWAQGKTMNTLTLLGLIVGVGMLVDNSVVIIENIFRYQEKGYPSRVAALLGAREVSIAVIAATLTSVIVFLPLIFSKPSEMNILLRELAMTVCFTLLASLFISQTLIPLATSRFIKTQPKQKTGAIMGLLRRWYRGSLAFTLRHKWLSPVIGFAVLGSAYFPFSNIDMNFSKSNTEMFVGLRYVFSEEVSLETKERIVSEVENILAQHKEQFEIDSIYSYFSDWFTTTRLYMKEGYTSEKHMESVRQDIVPLLPKVAGMELKVLDNQPFWRRNAGKRVGFNLEGKDSSTLAKYAQEAVRLLETVPGLYDVYTTAEGGKLEVQAKVDRDRARMYSVNANQPGAVVELSFRGRRMPRFHGPDGEVEVRMTMDEREVESLEQLYNLQVIREDGKVIPMSAFSSFGVVKGPDRLERNDGVTATFVGGKFSEGKREDYIEKVREVLSGMELPYGYRWDFQSPMQEEEESQAAFLINLLLALGLIFGVMAGLFESVRQAISLMVSLPWALAGAFWALYITNTDFDQPASVGLLLLLGIVVNNGIVMIEHINQYRRAGMERIDAMLQGGEERLRPILMTALTTLMGLIPMAIERPALGGVYYYSMAYVIMGGLLVSTVLTSLLLPATVCILEDVLGWVARLFGLSSPAVKNVDMEAARTP